MKAIQQGYTPKVLLNVLNEEGKISRSHGIPAAIQEAQAVTAGLPIRLISSSWLDYEKTFVSALAKLKEQYNVSHAVFGTLTCRHTAIGKKKYAQLLALKRSYLSGNKTERI